MKVIVLGLRGIPGVEGGIESHVESLAPLLVSHGAQIEVVSRSPYHPFEHAACWADVKITPIWSPKLTGLEAFVHTFIGVIYAGIKRPDIVHIHGVGPGLFCLLARLLGLKVVFTHHGPDYDREKWGRVAKWILRTGEKLACRYAHQTVVISELIARDVDRKYGVRSTIIPNGVNRPSLRPAGDLLRSLGLKAGQYVLQVSRFVPEKRQTDLIRAFMNVAPEDWKLVLVGRFDNDSVYGRQVSSMIGQTKKVCLAGFRTGVELDELYSNAGLFVLPSTHEGLPIALLEALSYGLVVVASDIPANQEIGLDTDLYFKAGDVEDLSTVLKQRTLEIPEIVNNPEIIDWVTNRYDWKKIAKKTNLVYERALNGGYGGRDDSFPV